MRRRRPFLNTILGVVIGAAACSGADPATGPGDAGPNFSSSGYTSTLQEALLKQLEESEKLRVDAAQKASQPTHDSLMVVWQAFLDSKPVQGSNNLLICDPLQYTAQVKIIGEEGGDIGFGPHKLRIPDGALSQPTVITAEMLTSLNVETRFSPHGLVFLKTPELELSYKHCYLPADFHNHSVVYLNDLGVIVETPASEDYKKYEYVIAAIWHFSRYAVAY